MSSNPTQTDPGHVTPPANASNARSVSDSSGVPNASSAPNSTDASVGPTSNGPTSNGPTSNGPWSPLAVPTFRWFWLASIVSNLGTWVHEVGAGWLMTSLDSSPEMVSSVRVAMTIPMVLMAIPAGLIADAVDRRKLLMATQWFLFACATTLSILTYTQHITAWSLLLLTFLTGIAMVMHILTWQSTIPELIPKSQLSRAVALGSISFNLARSVGPALGGVLIAMAGVWIAFAVNACSFAGVLLVLMFWKRPPQTTTAGQSVGHSVREGLQFVWTSRSMRHTLIRLGLFMIPAAALWSLLPLIARQRLMWDERGYGFLVTNIGMGAVFAVWFLHWIQRKLGFNRTIGYAGVIFAVALGLVGMTTNGILVSCLILVVGGAWMTTLTTFNSEVQLTLPGELRGRGMSCYYAVMAASMAIGSLLWGQVAGEIGVGPAIVVAATTLLFTGLIGSQFRLDERHD